MSRDRPGAGPEVERDGGSTAAEVVPALTGRLVRKSWLRRTIHISGTTDRLLEYDARAFGIGGDSDSTQRMGEIRIDGARMECGYRQADVYSRWGRHLYEEIIELQLPGLREPLPVEVRAVIHPDLVFQLGSLSVTVNGALVYQEEGGAVMLGAGSDLPIPSGHPRDEPGSLPIPSSWDDPEHG
jgi:hypothetical protein